MLAGLLDEAPVLLASKPLRAALAPYERPIAVRSVAQLATALGLFAIGSAAMYASLEVSYLLTLVLSVPTAGFLVRIFIIQHDCGHAAFFASRRLNDAVGTVCSLLTLTPYANWRRQHAAHHGNWNNLDRRISGADIYTVCLTVAEYRRRTPWQRFVYRASRHPLVAHVVIPPVLFLVLYRLPFDAPNAWWRERRAVYWTNAGIASLVGGLGLMLGFDAVVLVQLPIMVVGSIVGVFLFAVQHRFEGAVWAKQSEWCFTTAALGGSSYLRLPRVLQWFTGNIGFHHVHHLSPRVPNYRLRECHESVPELRAVAGLTLVAALRSVRLALWDETRDCLVGFGEGLGVPQDGTPGLKGQVHDVTS